MVNLTKKQKKYMWAGAIIPLVLIWGMLFISDVEDKGFALQPLIMLSIPLAIVGGLVGITVSKKKYGTLIGGGAGFAYFLMKYIPYSKLPRIEQRGFGEEIFIAVGVALVGAVIGWWIDKQK